MKRLIFLPLLFLTVIASSQVFNTSSTLRKGQFSFGVEPSFYIDGDTDFNLFLHGGFGLPGNMDLALKLGALGDEDYFGADIEFALGNSFSLSAGAHNYYDFGLDGTLLYTYGLQSQVDLLAGLDTDIVFADDDTELILWIPLGLEIGIQNNMSFILESEICLTDVGSHFLGGGLCFYF
jgi:hypothetical protein